MLSFELCCCCTPSPPSTPRQGARQFFESLNPLQGFKDTDELEAYLYDQSLKIEPKDGQFPNVKPKHSPEALKSPGVKPPKSAQGTFQRSRSHNVNHHNHNTLTITKAPRSPPTNNSSSSGGRHSTVTSPSSVTPNTAKSTLSPSPTEESHFAIIDINPGHQPKWMGDAGRINQAFTSEYASPAPLSASFLPPSPRSPSATSLASHLTQKKKPPAPLSCGETRFAFPPLTASLKQPAPPPGQHSPQNNGGGDNGAFPLGNPPRRRMPDPPSVNVSSHSEMQNTPLPIGGIATATQPPPLYPKSKRSSGSVHG
jgi:hypothetical protein